MTFAHPQFFHLLWLLPALVLLRVWSGFTARSAAEAFVAPRLRELLLATVPAPWLWLQFSLQLLALAGFVVSLTQPRWGEERRQIPETGRNVIIAVDVSRSMLADDVQPNRLMRAKLASQDILSSLEGSRVGLIAFAGRAYLQAPLTTDHEAVIESIQALDSNTIPRGGTIISDALREALEAFEKTKSRNHGLILFSDGGEEDADLDQQLRKAREKNVIVFTVGVGTDTGSLIPNPEPEHAGDYVRDPATNTPVHTRLESETLQKIARETGGRYLKLGEQSLNASIVQSVLSMLEAMESGNREEVKPIERFYWPLSFGMVCLMLTMFLRPRATFSRLSPAAAALLFFVAVPGSAHAALFSSGPTAEEAKDVYKAGDYPRARDLYARLLAEEPSGSVRQQLAYGLAASSHQLKDYDRAINGFSEALQSKDPGLQLKSHEGLGNALYDHGAKGLQQRPDATVKAWEDSLRHYDAALALNDDRKVRENRDFVAAQLKQLKQQMEQQKQQGKNKKKDKGKGDKDKGQKGEGDDEEDNQQDGKQDKKDGGKSQQKKEGDQKEQGQQQPGEQGSDGKEKDQQQAQNGQDKGDKEGEEARQGEPQKPLEGKIQAGEPGKPAEGQMAEAQEEQKQQETGYSRNEARSLLRTYNDQMMLQLVPRRERSVAKDW